MERRGKRTQTWLLNIALAAGPFSGKVGEKKERYLPHGKREEEVKPSSSFLFLSSRWGFPLPSSFLRPIALTQKREEGGKEAEKKEERESPVPFHFMPPFPAHKNRSINLASSKRFFGFLISGEPVHQHPPVADCVLPASRRDHPADFARRPTPGQVRPVHHDTGHVQVSMNSEFNN